MYVHVYIYWAYRLSTLFPESVTPGGGITLRERLRTHKVFTKYMYQRFLYLNYHKISIKSYVVDSRHMILWRNIENYHFLSF